MKYFENTLKIRLMGRLLVYIFNALQIKLISKIFSTFLRVVIPIFIQKWSFRAANLISNVKICDSEPPNL